MRQGQLALFVLFSTTMTSRPDSFSKEFRGEETKVEVSSKEQDVGTAFMPAEEQRLLRKLDRRILPITCLLYLFAC